VGNSDRAAAMVTLAESIADGQPIDWDTIEARASAGDDTIVRQLRVISTLAELHRSVSTVTIPPPDTTRSRQASAAPAIGSWGHLTLIERLGGGSSGDVYRAWDRHLERDVALKLLRFNDSIADLDTSRITYEGRLLARVRHPNVVTVYGVASHDNRVGLWMELVSGVTLEQRIRTSGPLGAHEAAMVGIDLCRALAAVHAAGLIHRDVKGQNVMREGGGRIVLMDLGTGREVGALSDAVAPDLAGTPLYLAPELFTGARAGERTDLYSLGVLLYHLVTGAFPIRATSIQELHEGHRAGRLIRLRDARPDLPSPFVRVVERAIANDGRVRYATAGEFEADLADALAHFTAPGETTTVSGRQGRNRLTIDRSWWRFAALAVAVALVVVVALRWSTLRRPSGAMPDGPIRSIAVLPLTNLSGDPAQEYFADGMTDQLIGTLGQLGDVNVISRTSAMQFKGSKKPLPEIARALNVDAVLEGAVVVLPGGTAAGAGDQKRVRITARLIYAGSDTQLWDKAFERVGADVLKLQSEVAAAVLEGLKLRLTSQQQDRLAHARAAASGARQFDVFDLYLKGRYYWNMRTEESLKRSIQYFQEATDLDPGYALGYAGLADAYSLLGYYGFVARSETHSRAAAAAAKALELDDTVAEAHASLAFLHEDLFEWDAAEARHKQALALKPGYATGHHWYAYHLAQRGRFPEAMDQIHMAMALDPLSVGVNGAFGAILIYARQYTEAISQLERAVTMEPGFARNRSALATACLLQGLPERAAIEIGRTEALGGHDPAVQAEIGFVKARTNQRAAATAIVRDLMQRYQRNDDGTAFGVALVYAGLGQKREALNWLEVAARSLKAEAELSGLKVDPRLDVLRDDPRFMKLLATVGLDR
jgi:eukaryotic-like serine/threonine-protein kinase